MGSSVIASIIEHYGYLNIPVRKLKLNDYLLSIRQLNDPYMKDKMINIILAHSKKISLGGLSVEDRDKQKTKFITDPKSIYSVREIEEMEFNSLKDMFFGLRQKYAKLVSYKNIKSYSNKHVILTTDLFKYKNIDELIKQYEFEFKKVKFINIYRSYESWIESLCSQYMSNSSYNFFSYPFIFSASKNFKEYEIMGKKINGHDIYFEDIFCRTEETLQKIAEFLEIDELNLTDKDFDLYGKIHPFKKVFKKADYKGKYLSKFSLFIALRMFKTKSLFAQLILFPFFHFSFMIDLYKYRLKN